MGRVRKLFESIVYAGMRPSGAAVPQKRLRWLGPLAGPVSRYLDGGANPSDPFYLSNRTLGQRIRLASVIAVPCLAIGVAIWMAALGRFDRQVALATPQPQAPTPAQQEAKLLPNLDKGLTVSTDRDIEISDVHIEKGAITKVAGVAHNTTGHAIENAELVFDLADSAGSRLGAVSTRVPRMNSRQATTFSFTVSQHNAAFALVREIRQP